MKRNIVIYVSSTFYVSIYNYIRIIIFSSSLAPLSNGRIRFCLN